MPEDDGKIFWEISELYAKYRWKEMKPEDFIEMTGEMAAYAQAHNWQENPLVFNLLNAVMETFDDLYRGGKVPKIPNFFGRSDLA